MAYVFDTLATGRVWHPVDREPTGAAFLAMREAEGIYHRLSAKGRRVTTAAFGATWSPDGRKLAFSLGSRAYSGVAIYDLAANETELLIMPGRDPRWSPDGRYIAFVRDCQVLHPEKFASYARKDEGRSLRSEEIWVLKSDGTEPRRLVRGGWASWGQDSTTIYYQSRLDDALCSISIVGRDPESKRIMACASAFPSVSPDNQQVAYLDGAWLRVKNLVSQTPVGEWPACPALSGGPAWSPAGRELCLTGRSNSDDRSGLWVYSLEGSEPARVLDGQITGASWAPDGTKLALCLGQPYHEIWVAALDPNLSTIEALGPGQGLQEHYREMLRLYTRRVEADPYDPYAYSGRALYRDYLQDREGARADMRRFSAILSGGLSDSSPSSMREFRYVITGPSNCQLVLTVAERAHEIPLLCIAFGQKGRWEMRLFEIPMYVASLLGLGLLSGLDGPAARADFTFGEPVRVETVIPTIDPVHDSIDCFSYDGLEIYVESDRPGGYGGVDSWVIRRASTEDDWGPPELLGVGINSPENDGMASISADGLTLYFFSYNRPGGYGHYDIYMATRPTKNDPWGPATNLGPKINTSAGDGEPWISPDGLELYVHSWRPGGYGRADIYVAKRATQSDPWGEAVNLGPVVNSEYDVQYPSLSPDGLWLLFCDGPFYAPAPGGFGGSDLWMARRESLASSWQAPVNLGRVVNGPGGEYAPRISPDGRTLYFWAMRDGTFGNWQAPIIPIVDFNGDGKLDAKDMAVLGDNWGQNKSVCDVGPFPWGDGVVNEKDLSVFLGSVISPAPHASDVSCDVTLNWISPSFAPTCDVYFGTSFEAVKNADRADPCGVLVSQGQTATTYDPEGLLEFEKTYYWRIDFVSAGVNPTIYKGAVWQFTAEAAIYPIRNVTATASSFVPNNGPEKTIDRSGLDANDLHSNESKDMWWSKLGTLHWIQYGFDRVYKLDEMWVWNYNLAIEPSVGFGARMVKIEYSTDGTTWTTLDGVAEFAQAPGQSGCAANTKVNFGGVSAKYVKLTITKNWGVTKQTGLSEVRFYAMSAAAAAKP